MKAHLIDTHLLVPRSRLSAKVKVKYQGHVSQNMGVSGALVFHKHILLTMLSYTHKPFVKYVKKPRDCVLSLSQTTDFRRFHTERVCR